MFNYLWFLEGKFKIKVTLLHIELQFNIISNGYVNNKKVTVFVHFGKQIFNFKN